MQHRLELGIELSTRAEAVESLGRQFSSELDRQRTFSKELEEHLTAYSSIGVRGAPDAQMEDILATSNPPCYTTCPNPFLEEWVRMTRNSKEDGVREPYVGELTASARHPVYSFHPYHTKVPPEIIRRLIEHYTEPGDIVLDAFSGSGMTGVAAREANRNAVLVDLSPIAAFIAGVNTTSHDWRHTVRTLQEIIAASKKEWGHLYETTEAGHRLEVNYFVWSDVFTCPECAFEFPFFPHGVVHHGNKVETRERFSCPGCSAELNVRRVERVVSIGTKKKRLVWVNAGAGKKRINREPSESDLELARQAEQMEPPRWYPTDPINPYGYSAKLAQLGDKQITDISRFLSRRNLTVFADLWDRVRRLEDAGIRHLCWSTLSSIFTIISERQGYFGGGGGMSGNMYMPIVRMEKNVYDSLARKLKKLEAAEIAKEGSKTTAIVSTQSATDLAAVPGGSIDYIYTDPPFGANIIYSEMNLMLEGWLRVRTNRDPEAVIDSSRQRGFDQYAELMRDSFREYFRVLKPGRWITVEFHNTQASVWNLIQTAIGESGFVVAQVGFLDKGSTTILADIRPGAAKYDLVISAYKPRRDLEQRFQLQAGREEGVWEFVQNHLGQVPIAMVRDGKLEIIPERQRHLLFDRMVAFHVQRGSIVPISAAEFYRELARRFPERDGMYFLPEQTSDYDRQRVQVDDLNQFSLFVSDEASAIRWIREQLQSEPRTFQEIQPAFMKELQAWAKHERTIELIQLLRENFLHYDGGGLVPNQIVQFMAAQDPQLGGLERDDPRLVAGARGLWYVPDPNSQADLDRLRERTLWAEFEGYKNARGTLREFRTEAIRVGFKVSYDQQDYQAILEVAKKLPEDVLHEDSTLLMYRDVADMRSEP